MHKRSCYCGEINKSLVKKNVDLCGWVHRKRNLGGVIFITLRDRAGLVQVVFRPEKKQLFAVAESLHAEDVMWLKGVVKARPKAAVNKELATGNFEVEVDAAEIISRSESPPFFTDEKLAVNEDLRLKYRYLDLRRPEMMQNVVLRAKVARVIRDFLDNNGFLEVETPILTKTTPEGARDYLVPSRKSKGSCYALPQSPQIFKQLLMVAGVDKYYQVCRCFRDEDIRADRQPEFTQLDIEMSFIDEVTIQHIIEELMRELFAKTIEVKLPKQFPRMTYAEAMQRYGSDKPDLRIPLELIDVADLVKDVEFKVFADNAKSGRVAGLCLPGGASLTRKQLDAYADFVAVYGAKGLAHIKVNDLRQGVAGLQSSILKFLPDKTVLAILERFKAKTGDIIFFAAGDFKIVTESLGALRVHLGTEHDLVRDGWYPLWLEAFPMFEKTDQGLTSLHHPFTSPADITPEALIKNPEQALSRAYDLILNGVELGGGSIRIIDQNMQQAVFKILGINEKQARQQFGHLLEALQYGCPPHGGIAFGFDRIVAMLAGEESIREVIAFPKTTTATCPLTGAPAGVDPKQLKELGLKASK